MQRKHASMTSAKIITLPPARWREAKELRLEALLNEAIAFASSYADEKAFGDDLWIARLQSAVQRDNNMTFYAELDGKLVGMATANWRAREKTRHAATIYSVYVSQVARGRGIGLALLRTILQELSALPHIEKVSLTVNSDCLPALRLYQRLGFKLLGTAKRELKVDGRYYDLHYLEMLFES